MIAPVLRITLIIVLTLAGYPLVAGLSEFSSLPNREVSIGMRSIILCAVFVHLFYRLQRSVVRVKESIFMVTFFIFWAFYFCRLIIDLNYNTEALKIPFVDYLLFGFGTCFVPASVMFWMNLSDFNSNKIVNLFVHSANLAIIFFVLNIYNGGALSLLSELTSLRGASEYLNPISISHLGASLVIVCFWKLFENNENQRNFKSKAIYAVGIVIGVVAIIVGASRGPILTAVLALIFYAASNFKKVLNIRNFLLITAFIVMIVILIEAESVLALNRINEGSFKDEAREYLFDAGIQLVMNNPFAGAGIEPLYSYPHNLLLESFMTFGLLGGLMFAYILFIGVVSAWQLIRKQTHHGWVALLYVQYAAGAMVSGSLYGSNSFWILTTLTFTLNLNIKKYRKIIFYKSSKNSIECI